MIENPDAIIILIRSGEFDMTGTLYYDQVKNKPVIKSGNKTQHIEHGEMIEIMSILPGMVNQGAWNVVKVSYDNITELPFGGLARTIK